MNEHNYDYEYEWDSYYCYPNSYVLKNKLGITNAEALKTAEREITAIRLAQMKDKPIKGKLDFKHLRNIHKAIFGDVFAWAGKLRTVNIAKGNQFCLFQHLETYANTIFNELKTEKYLVGITADKIPERLTYYLSEINVLHPFRDGNGRAQRVFIEYLARSAGYYVDFSDVSGREMIEASALSFCKEYEMMTNMFNRIVSKTNMQEQRVFRKLIGMNSVEQ